MPPISHAFSRAINWVYLRRARIAVPPMQVCGPGPLALSPRAGPVKHLSHLALRRSRIQLRVQLPTRRALMSFTATMGTLQIRPHRDLTC